MIDQRLYRFFCFSLFLTALACGIWAALIPGEGKGFLFGMSAARFAIVSLLFGIGLICLFLSVYRMNIFEIFATIKNLPLKMLRNFLLVVAFLGFFLGGIALIAYFLFSEFAWARVLERILPITTFFMIGGVGYALLTLIQRVFGKKVRLSKPAIIFLGTFFFFNLMIFSALVWKLGLTYEPGGWMAGLPVPVFPSQVGFLFAAGLLIPWLLSHTRLVDKKNDHWVDVLIGVLIWSLAISIWSGYKMPNTYFLPRPMPPTMQYFPYSDARVYDRAAYSILTGETGLNQRIPDHPLYPFFLSLLHAFAGDRYQNVISVQTALLACFPVALYFLGKQISGRLAGIFAATVGIMREANTLSVASLVLTSNSKLYMTELPAALLFCVTCILIIRQLKHADNQTWKWILIGALFGGAVMLRLQSIVVYLFSLAAIGLVLFDKKRSLIKPILLLVIGLLLIVSPWVVRNYSITGSIMIDSPRAISQATALVGLQIPEKESRDAVVDPSKALDYSFTTIFKNPIAYLYQTLNHFVHSEIVALYSFPVLAQPVKEVETIFNPPVYYWSAQDDPLPKKDLPALIAVIFFISAGVVIGFGKLGWSALIPLLFHLTYNLSSALVRFSGWRFGLPVDWILMLYGSVALAWVANQIILLFLNRKKTVNNEIVEKKQSQKIHERTALLITSAGILMIGLAFPLFASLPAKYAKTDREVLLAEIELLPTLNNAQKQAVFAAESQTILKGISLYPRYYKEEESEPGSDVFYKGRDYARLLFIYIGSENLDVDLGVTEMPEQIRHAEEVIMGGQIDGKYFYADWVLVNSSSPTIYFRD